MLIASIIFLAVSQVLHFGGVTVSMDYYTHPGYGDLWSPLIVSFGNFNTGLTFFFVSIIFGFIGAVLFVSVFTVMVKGLKGSAIEKGVTFGVLVFLVANVPSSLSMFMLLSIPVEIVLLWTLESFIVFLLGGALVGRIIAINTVNPELEKEKTKFKFKEYQPKQEKSKDKEKKQQKPKPKKEENRLKADEPEWMSQMDAGNI